jgi:hypothetical protein
MHWLLRDEQKQLFDYIFASVLCLLFLLLSLLVLWPLGKAQMVLRFAEGFGVFWLALSASTLVLLVGRRLFRVDLYSRVNAYVISGLIVSAFWQMCWSAFASVTVLSFSANATWRVFLIVSLMGVLSCYVAFVDVSAFYHGHIYKLVNAPLAFVSFVAFSIWPRVSHRMFGWLIDWL